MTRNIMHPPHSQPKANTRNQRRTDVRIEADDVLRDIAFVLKMTQRVHDEIEADEEACEPALA
jgi:hypothetical protein